MKTKKQIENEMKQQMEQEEALARFKEHLNELECKKQEFAVMGAEAQLSGDEVSLDSAMEGILFLEESIMALRQAKLNYDVTTLSSTTTQVLAGAMNALGAITTGKANIPNYDKIIKTQKKLARYMQDVKVGRKMMTTVMKNVNPAKGAVRSEAERKQAMALISAQRARLNPSASYSGARNAIDAEIAKEIEKPII